ncbi:DNA polymerase beta-like region [Moorella thermoacetica]|uniref:DNA polymerase, beta-like region n=1 Tax=Moorella thermoacetica (strain ATCC 39073 / JCM 9320) TaxID=264732 RepID=Q2RM25_MOOTA|nr:nucleotidyltransferase domain-containing protein [Moorella thermoacetica]AKX93008.1 nucleotidyltransferase domain protein [Moorella thermoacetica]AKX95560.1 nucleotidyltransferase domain protein [Moorella thermoacetica]OIQ52717.1 nucleotidyltransferase domain protein [Moorella thermoacetica]QCZ99370.1 Nucleotidyltransferase domain protein [Moorella thermoacetica]TYL07765.1 hypothetical protein MOOCA_21110 [Moorella thermoacetica]
MNELEEDILYRFQGFFKTRNIDLAYLFGSRARGKASPLSDYDFAILAPDMGTEEYYRLLHELSMFMGGAKVDVVMLKFAPVELQYRVIKDGILLYQKDGYTRVEFEGNILSRYFDFLPVLRQQRENVLKEGKSEKRVQRYREALGKTLGVLNEIRTAQNQIIR